MLIAASFLRAMSSLSLLTLTLTIGIVISFLADFFPHFFAIFRLFISAWAYQLFGTSSILVQYYHEKSYFGTIASFSRRFFAN